MIDTYSICESRLHNDEIGDYTSYDIALKRDDTIILNVSDVFVRRFCKQRKGRKFCFFV